MKAFIILIALIVALPSFASSKDYADVESSYKTEAQIMLNLVNEHREKIGKSALEILPMASEKSTDHSNYMAFNLRGLTHDGFSRRVNEIREKSGFAISRSAENVAYNYSVERAHNALLNSPGHKRNIEGNYTHVGIGVVSDESNRIYFTQIFLNIQD